MVAVEADVTFDGDSSSVGVALGEVAEINVASIAGFQPTPGTATYGATKAFVQQFSAALPNTQVAPTDFGIGESRLEFSPNNNRYAAYFHVHGVDPNSLMREVFSDLQRGQAMLAVAVVGCYALILSRTYAWVRRSDTSALLE